MTSRTHDLAAFSALTFLVSTQPVPDMTLATALVALGANFLGATFPDLDEPTAMWWQRIPAGSIFGRLIKPLFGGHRMISHSFVGLLLTGWLLKYLLTAISGVLIVDMSIVWLSFMIGYASHLLIDTITKEGVPWLFPFPFKIGIPPFRFFRATTGGFFEKSVIFPGLLVANAYIIYTNYSKFLELVTKLVK